ncbi:MAG: acyltransferase domain-containing protein [Actinomycetota bacterium]|nr:acyltransferase domain-containing protein [Actinomycetota bacterium]
MISVPALTAADVLDLLGVEPQDEAECSRLLAGEPGPAVAKVLELLAERLGSEAEAPARHGQTELSWIEGYLRFTPEIVRWHAEHDVPEVISRATLADIGRNLAINRRVHGRFGLDTWPWLGHHFAGQLYQLGRLQYLLHRNQGAIPGVRPDEWILGIHIPESGSLAPAAVAQSLALARPFIGASFPDRPVNTANCASWLLDPYLPSHLDAASNIVSFARMFEPYGRPVDTPSDAVYFTFRTRSMDRLAELPRGTALQRTVLERIEDGGTWQLGQGYLTLP